MGDFVRKSRRSSAAQTPPAAPNGTPWESDRSLGTFAAENTASFQNPNYPMEALQHALSDLSLAENALRSRYEHEAAVGVVKSSQRHQLEEFYARFTRFVDGDQPLFNNAHRSASLPRNLAEHVSTCPSPYVFGNGGGVDFYGAPFHRGLVGSSSSSYSSNNHAFMSGEMANGSLGRNYPCGMVDCACQFQLYPQQQQQQHQHQQVERRHKSRSNYSHGGGGRNARPKLEMAPGFVNLMDLRGSVMSWATDQNGCRVLQAKIQEAKEEEIDMILSEVIDHSSELMTHPCGNYFTQKLIDVCTEEQRSSLLFSVIEDSRQLISICCDNHGTRCIQKLLENLKPPRLITQFMLALRPGVLKLIKDPSGYHVIQYCLNSFPPHQTKYMLKEVVDHCFDIARDINGCRVINQCVGNTEGEDRERLLSEIIECALPLSEDLYGNYVVQYILDLENAQLNARILRKLTGNFVSLSRNKFGSHVVEKCFGVADFYQSSYIIRELLWSPFLLTDPYGNFVIQAALSVAQGDAQRALFKLIEDQTPLLRTNMFGRKVLGAYEKRKSSARVNMYYR